MIADAAPQGHVRAPRWPHLTMRNGTALLVALGAPALVTLLAFTSVRTVVPGLLYTLAIILATVAGGRVGGLIAVAASAFPFFYFFASRYDRIVKPHFERVLAERWPHEQMLDLDTCGDELVN